MANKQSKETVKGSGLGRYLPSRDTPGQRVIFNLIAVFCWLGLWLLIMSACQGGWSKFGASLLYILAAIAISVLGGSLREQFTKYPLMIIAFLFTALTLFALYATGSLRSLSQFTWDFFGIGLGLVLYVGMEMSGILFRMGNRQGFRPNNISPGQRWLMIVMATWIGVTLTTMFRPALDTPDPSRFASIASPANSDWQKARVGVALSGGGYRAAVFHTGTLHALESLGIRINNLSTVSGGSIVGAYYANGGDPVKFKNAVAKGRFNLKRELLLLHNAIRLACPMRIPIFDVELLPACNFSRRDVQASMMDRLMFDGRDHEQPANTLSPSLVINTTDFTYGQLIGFLPKGLVIQAPDLKVHIYRGEAYQPEQTFSLSERVALSGAFPIAFPPGEFNVKVYPQGGTGTGHGTRQLWLADGGISDNSGIHSLIGVHRFACVDTFCDESYTVPKNWRSDLMLISDGGAIFGVESELGTAGQLSRAVDIGGARTGKRLDRLKNVPTVSLSAQLSFLDPGRQFRNYKDPEDRRPSVDNRDKTIRFRPARDYPHHVLDKLFALLPSEKYPNAALAWRQYKLAQANHINDSIDLNSWTSHMSASSNKEKVDSCSERRLSGPEAETLQALPGICEAVLLKYAVITEIGFLLDAFRSTSTLDDQFGTKRTDELFRLGQMLVYINWSLIDRAFREANKLNVNP